MPLASLLAQLSSDSLRLPILKLLFRKNGLSLTGFKSFENNRYFLYRVNGVYLAAESLGWAHSPQQLEALCRDYYGYGYYPVAGDVVIDIGAGLGGETLVFSKAVGPQGRIISIEANPQVFQVLGEVVRLNNLSNVTLLNIALYTASEPVTLEDTGDTYLSGSLHKKNGQSSKSFTVPGMLLSEIMQKNNVEKVDLLKVNIEGAERFLVEEAHPEIFQNIHNVAISCHDFRYRAEGDEFFATRQLITEFLQRQGYKIQTQSTGIESADDWVYGKRS